MSSVLDIKSRFGTAVRSRRKHLRISQEELAERAGLHRTYVADVERGARNLSLANIEKLACALELSLPALFARAIPPGAGNHFDEHLVDILLVEDEADDVELTLSAFESAKLTNRVHVVRDGGQALDFLFCRGKYAGRKMEERPQIILLDLKLPDISGLDVLRMVKNDKRTQMIPVAVLTGSEREQDIIESRRLGAESYILKPVNFQRLAEATPALKLSWALLHGHPTVVVGSSR